jgi:protein-S-isoprenylcysteine O-methyltransferase Ste14
MPLPNWLAIAGLLCWVGYDVALRQRADSETASWQGDAEDRGSTRLLMLTYALAAVAVIVCSTRDLGWVPAGPRWVGVAILVAGLALRAWAMAVLGRDYTRTLRVAHDQQVVTAGPYRLIRHPGYTGSLLVWTGYALGTGSWIALLVVIMLLLVAYGWRIRAEEAVLVNSFGERYIDYQRGTRRLLPFVY